MNKKGHTCSGQAIIEFVILVPMLVFFLMFSFQVFKTIYAASVAQENAKAALMQKINYRANGRDELAQGRELAQDPQAQGQDFRVNRIQTGGIPFLSIDGQATEPISQRLGICRTMKCGD